MRRGGERREQRFHGDVAGRSPPAYPRADGARGSADTSLAEDLIIAYWSKKRAQGRGGGLSASAPPADTPPPRRPRCRRSGGGAAVPRTLRRSGRRGRGGPGGIPAGHVAAAWLGFPSETESQAPPPPPPRPGPRPAERRGRAPSERSSLELPASPAASGTVHASRERSRARPAVPAVSHPALRRSLGGRGAQNPPQPKDVPFSGQVAEMRRAAGFPCCASVVSCRNPTCVWVSSHSGPGRAQWKGSCVFFLPRHRR